jgi:hypothetical protein
MPFVPHLIGLMQPEAEVKLQEAGLVVGAIKKRHNNSLPKGGIIRTDPEGGAPASPGSPVGLEVSTGPESPWSRFADVLVTLLRGPLSTGVLLTLIGVVVLLFGEKANGVIVCYVGVMTLIVSAGKIWMQHIRERADRAVAAPSASKAAGQSVLDVADLREQSENAILVACCFLGIVITALAIVGVATLTVFKGGTATGLFWGLGSLFSGGFLGFLFSIPFETEQEKSAKTIEHLNTMDFSGDCARRPRDAMVKWQITQRPGNYYYCPP